MRRGAEHTYGLAGRQIGNRDRKDDPGARIAEEAFENTRALYARDDRKEVAAELIYSMLKLGADGLSFDLSSSGSPLKHTARRPDGRGDKTGTFLTMDFGCIKDGYCSDMTRTVAVGGYTDEMRAVYETVLRAQESMRKPHRSSVGRPAAAADVIGSAGFGAYFATAPATGSGLSTRVQQRFPRGLKGTPRRET